MTALTFGDENNDQDLEEWEDVLGVPRNIVPRPPDLISVFRSWKVHELKTWTLENLQEDNGL
jgi:hypothetical protein